MHLPLVLFVLVAAVVAGGWSWLGKPVPMPPSPVAAGEKLYCVSYAPFRGQQSPLGSGTQIPAAQIDADLAQLAKVTSCVRTYSVEHGLDQVPAIAAKYGLQVIQGIWLSSDPAKNQWQFDTAVPIINRYRDTIRAVVVGNEVLLRGELSATAVADMLRRVKAATGAPVTYADVWEFWLRHRDLAPAVDFITVHILPYWEDFPIPAREAAAHVDAIRKKVVEAFPGREILIGETGWPSEGRMREGALPSPANQALVLHEVLNAAKAGNYRVNLIEAYDQPWKRALEGTVGGHWGLYEDQSRAAKFVWGEPVSNRPHWLAQAGAGIAFAALIFFAAFAGRPQKSDPAATAAWVGIAIIAAAGGLTLGIAIENIPLESFGLGGWIRSLALGLVAVTAPPLAAVALARGIPIPPVAHLLGGVNGRPGDSFTLALGGAFILLCVVAIHTALGLVFDPRYKDFPYAPLAAPVAGYLVLAFVGLRGTREYGTAERIAAAALAFSAVYVSLNEGFANWQAQSVAALLAALAFTLLRVAGVRKPGSAV